MSPRAHYIWATIVAALIVAALVALAIVINDAMQSSWLCAHQWKAC